MRGCLQIIFKSLFALLLLFAPGHAFASMFDAIVTRVIDGDTFKFSSTTLNVTVHDTCRMADYNAPDPRGKEKPLGLKAKTRLVNLIEKKQIRILASKKGKYGRWLCKVWVNDKSVTKAMRLYLKDYPHLDKHTKRKKRK